MLFIANRFPRDARQEASLDAQAAVQQAQSIGQPAGSAIYFGVDFNFAASDTETIDNMISYFREIRDTLAPAG